MLSTYRRCFTLLSCCCLCLI